MKHSILIFVWRTLMSAALCACADAASDRPHRPQTRETPRASQGFGSPGPLTGDARRAGFRFGVASSATQIEDANEHTDWWIWTAPKPDGLGNGEFIGDAAHGFSDALRDVELLTELGVDAYRFGIEWARVEPERDVIDEAALAHYSELIDALIAHGIRPMITLHHFSNPIWVDDPRDPGCSRGPSDTNLCGWNHAQGGPAVVEEFEEHARLLAERFGDRVDEWVTLNEPFLYASSAYGVGQFPPGKTGLLGDYEGVFLSALRNLAAGHVVAYRALHEADGVDADGDGVPAAVGLAMATVEFVASRDAALSTDPSDIAGRDRMSHAFNFLFSDVFARGGLDTDLDGAIDEPHPDWQGTLDWLGVQYYQRAGVTSAPALFPKVLATPCFGGFDFGACVPALDPSYEVPAMKYEHWPEGLYHRLIAMAERYPGLPLVVTESGIATRDGTRRSEVLVRALEQVERARDAGADVRGYYHWSIHDNFEWTSGRAPRFGLYQVDYESQTRTPTEAVGVYAEIVAARAPSAALRETYGGRGALTPEPTL